ncbi:FIG098404: Hypothetical protein [Alloactinosynnema sp. L-07]|nr:FIG098404: Hypothetical protein [Alloactinosynnema sp. L-07]
MTTVADFHRARYLYQLTGAGQAAEEAIAVYEEAIGRRGSLQSVALADIAVQLRALVEVARGEDLDPAKVHLLLLALADRFTGLADNAQAFMASLRRVIDFADGDVAAFVAYKQRLIGYVERFIADLADPAPRSPGCWRASRPMTSNACWPSPASGSRGRRSGRGRLRGCPGRRRGGLAQPMAWTARLVLSADARHLRRPGCSAARR